MGGDDMDLVMVEGGGGSRVVADIIRNWDRSPDSVLLVIRSSRPLREHLDLAPGDLVVWFELNGYPCIARFSDASSVDGRPLLGVTRVSRLRGLRTPVRALALLGLDPSSPGSTVELEWFPVGRYACLKPLGQRPPGEPAAVKTRMKNTSMVIHIPGWVRALTGINSGDTIVWYDYKGKPCIARLNSEPANGTATSKVSPGRPKVTIPKSVRTTHNIKPGDRLQWIILDGHICLDKLSQTRE